MEALRMQPDKYEEVTFSYVEPGDEVTLKRDKRNKFDKIFKLIDSKRQTLKHGVNLRAALMDGEPAISVVIFVTQEQDSQMIYSDDGYLLGDLVGVAMHSVLVEDMYGCSFSYTPYEYTGCLHMGIIIPYSLRNLLRFTLNAVNERVVPVLQGSIDPKKFLKAQLRSRKGWLHSIENWKLKLSIACDVTEVKPLDTIACTKRDGGSYYKIFNLIDEKIFTVSDEVMMYAAEVGVTPSLIVKIPLTREQATTEAADTDSHAGSIASEGVKLIAAVKKLRPCNVGLMYGKDRVAESILVAIPSYSLKLLDLALEVVESDVYPYLRGEKDRDQIIASRKTSLRK